MIDLEVNLTDEADVRVSWRLSGQEFTGETLVELLRSDSFTGPYETILPASADVTDLLDTHQERGVRYFYKLRAHRGAEVEEFPASGGVTLAPEQDSEVRAVLRQVIWNIRNSGGRKVLYYPIRRSGSYCHCYDPISGKGTRKNCRSCFGESYQGGYFNPIIIHAAIGAVSLKASERFRIQGGMSSGMIPYIPMARDGDVIIEKENKRWQVIGADPVEYKRTTVRQTVYLAPIAFDDIRFEIPVDFDVLGSDQSAVRTT